MKTPSAITRSLITLLAPILWGTTYVVITEVLPDNRPLLIAMIQVIPAGLLLVAIGAIRSRWWPSSAQWRRLAFLALVNFGAFYPIITVATYRLPGGVTASLGGLQPLLVGFLTWIAIRKTMTRLEIIIGIIAAVGVAMVVIRPSASVDLLGLLAALGANLTFAIGVVATKRFPAFPDQIAATGYQALLSLIVLVPTALIIEGPPPAISVSEAMGFAYLSLAATGLAYAIWFVGVRRLPTQVPPVLGLAAPLTGAALGWVLLDQDLTIIQMLGFATTIGAITYAATFGTTRSTEAIPATPA